MKFTVETEAFICLLENLRLTSEAQLVGAG